jgi:hypothetical protein
LLNFGWLRAVLKRRAPVARAYAGTLIKLVYTASCGGEAELRFAKFERRRLDECFDFIRAEGLLGCNGNHLAGCTAEFCDSLPNLVSVLITGTVN